MPFAAHRAFRGSRPAAERQTAISIASRGLVGASAWAVATSRCRFGVVGLVVGALALPGGDSAGDQRQRCNDRRGGDESVKAADPSSLGGAFVLLLLDAGLEEVGLGVVERHGA